MQESYYMLPEEDLPEVFRKIIAVRRKLSAQPQLSVSAACRQENLSRSAYYKYRESLHRFTPTAAKAQVILNLQIDLALRTDLQIWKALSKFSAILKQAQLSMSGPEEAFILLTLEWQAGEWEANRSAILAWQQEWHGLKSLKILSE